MPRLAALLLLLAACSSEPTDDALDDEGGSSGDSGGVGTEGDDEGESSSSEGGSTGEPEPAWPPECLEATPTEEATCSAIRGIVAAGTGSGCDLEPMALACEDGDWAISDVAVDWYADGDITDPDAVATMVQSDRLDCDTDSIVWTNEPYDPAATTPSMWRMTWRATFDDLVYQCRRAGSIVPGGVPPSARGDSTSFCMLAPLGPTATGGPGEPNPLEDVESCCVESGTPVESSGLPMTPCE
jgi:hypothetical protein